MQSLGGMGVNLHLNEGRMAVGGSITGFWDSLYVPSMCPLLFFACPL
jgi:hypothetical protein